MNDTAINDDDGVKGISPEVLKLVPKHPAALTALNIALSSLPTSIVNHSFRVYIYSKAMNTSIKNWKEDPESMSTVEEVLIEDHVLFVACMMHDIGIIEKYDEVPRRFEIVGADNAATTLRSFGVDEKSIREAWLAISLHSTPGIAEHFSGTVKALRLAIMAEFGAIDVPFQNLSSGERELLSKGNELQRLRVEEELGDAIVRQGRKTHNKAPCASWPGVMLKAFKQDPRHVGVNKAFWDCS